jgi:hypothetical protein
VLRAANGSERSVKVSYAYSNVGFPSDSSVVVVNESGAWQLRDAASLRAIATYNTFAAPAGFVLPGMSQDGAYAGSVGYGIVWVWRMSAASNNGRGQASTVPDSPASALAIRKDGRQAAAAESGTIYITRLIASSRSPYDIYSKGGTPPSGGILAQLTGGGDTDLVAFLGTGGRLASASGATIALWDMGQVSRLAMSTGVSIPFDSLAGPPPFLLAARDGTWLSVVGGNATGTSLIRDGHRQEKPAAQGAKWYLPMSADDKPLLIGAKGTDLVLAHGDGAIFRSWPGQMPDPATARSDPVAAGMLPGGNQFAVIRGDGSIGRYDIPSGTVRQLVPSGSHPEINAAPQQAAVSPDGRAAVVSGQTIQPPSEPVPVMYVDLRTGATHQVGAGGALGVLFTRDSLVIERPTGEFDRRHDRTFPWLCSCT